jgi:putative transposase
MSLIIEKKHRLPRRFYKGNVIVAFTLCIKNKSELFTERIIFDIFENILLTESKKQNCEILVYLFMPDHCHLILKGNCENSDPLTAINRFKQKSGYWLSKNDSGIRWQKNYFDHILRDHEHLQKHIEYILNNPVRKRIVTHWRKYPFKGSTKYNVNSQESSRNL